MHPIAIMLSNPWYAIQFHPALSTIPAPNDQQRSEWLETNIRLLPQLGTDTYLPLLLDVLGGYFIRNDDANGDSWSDDQLRRMMINPAYAVRIHATQLLPHQTSISKKLWIETATELIGQIGVDGFLDRMLTSLESPLPDINPD